MKRIAVLLLGFGYMVLSIEALRVGVAWWRGDIEHPGVEEWLMLASLPVLAWVWWQYLSPFGRGRGQCLLPENRGPKP